VWLWGEVQDLCDWSDVDVAEQMKVPFRLSERISELEASGRNVYGCKIKGRAKFAGIEDEWEWSVIAVFRDNPQEIPFPDGKISVFRPSAAKKQEFDS
jgi:hypothetical protein